MLLKSAKLFN